MTARVPASATSSPKASGAFGWSMLNTLTSRVGTFGIGIVLARILGPESFGTFAVALVALLAVLSFNELGVSLAIVRWQGDPALIASTVNTISVAASTAVYAAAFLLAPAFTELMGDPEATPVVRLLVLCVVINGVAATPAALLQREFRERTRMAIDQSNVWIGAVLSVLLALLGVGAMALAVGRLVGSLVAAVMFVRASPLSYRFGLDRAHLPGLLRFGLPLAGTSLVVFLVGFADQLTAGALLGTSALAFYVMAFNLSGWPVSFFSQPLRRVAPAAFSALQHDPPRLRAALLAIIGVVAAATVPFIAFLAAAAVHLVGVVYGDAWVPAAAALSWLVASAVCRVFYELAYDYLVVLGLSGTVFSIQASSLIVLLPALVLGAWWGGIAGLAAAQAAVATLVLLPIYLWQLRRTGVRLLGVWSCTWPALLAGVAAWLSGTTLMGVGLPPLLSLALGGAVSAALSAAALYPRRGAVRMVRAISRPAIPDPAFEEYPRS